MMYLVHLALTPPPSGATASSQDLCAAFRRYGSTEGLEHVSAHACACPRPVVGLYLRAASLTQAEAMARAIWSRASVSPALTGWLLYSSGVVLLAPGLRTLPESDLED